MSLIEKAVQRLDQLKRADETNPLDASSPLSPDEAGPTASPKMIKKAAEPGKADARVAAPPPALPASISRQVDIDLARLASIGMVTPDKPRTMLAEQFR